jgi:hypothetical protein
MLVFYVLKIDKRDIINFTSIKTEGVAGVGCVRLLIDFSSVSRRVLGNYYSEV